MVEISVIIPVYNVEEYLQECLNSILEQSFNDIEVICINDGSTDNSIEILNDYNEKDSRIIIHTQDNQGLSASRNKGLELAKGKYVYFCDGDDYLELNALEELYDLSEKHETDFIMFKMNNFDDETKESIIDDYYDMPHLKERVGNDLFNYDDVKDMALELAVNVPANFYRREFISDLRFPVGLLYEDNVFFTHALFKAEKVYFHDKRLYNRRMRRDSLSKSVSMDTIDISDLLLDLCRKYNHPTHKKELYYRIFSKAYQIFDEAPDEDKDELFLEIKDKYMKYGEKWSEDEYFTNEMSPRYMHIYQSAISSDNHVEFDLRVKIYDVKHKISRIKRQNKRIKRKVNKLKKENNLIKSSKGYKFLNRQ